MLKGLFGSRDKELILQYLLVAKEGYASKIAQFWELNIPQINKLLLSLEEDGILTCKEVGKTRVYSFSENCAYIEELKSLLSKVKQSYDISKREKLNSLQYAQVKPGTRRKSGYYSGVIALNLFPDDANGDWHSSAAVNALKNGRSKSPYFIMGRQGRLSTRKYLKDSGIIDISKTLSRMENTEGITKAARPYRAVADMVLVSLLNGKNTDHIQLDDWLVTEEEQDKFNQLLNDSMSRMNYVERERVSGWMQNHHLVH